MQVTRILALRHGETAWNQDNRIQGQLDIPLNDTGRWQAAQAAQALREESVAAVYASDLGRAAQTAQAIADSLGHTVQHHTGLRERHFGDCQGERWQDLETQRPEVVAQWRARVPDFAPPGGESLLVLRRRVQNAFSELAARHLGEQIVVVAHGGVLDIVYRWAAGVDLQAPRTWHLGNAAINRLLWTPDSLHLVGWGDTGHLDGARDETTA